MENSEWMEEFGYDVWDEVIKHRCGQWDLGDLSGMEDLREMVSACYEHWCNCDH